MRAWLDAYNAKLLLWLLVGLGVAPAGCSFSFSVGATPESTAEDLIENDFTEQLGLSDVVAECGKPPNTDPGSTFTCTSTTDIGEISWLATIEEGDRVGVEATNLLESDDVSSVEALAIQQVEAETGVTIGIEDIDCGTGPLVLGAGNTLACSLTSPLTEEVYETTITFSDVETGSFEISGYDRNEFRPGDSPEALAERLIEGDLAAQLGLSDVVADCMSPASREPGATFTCTSLTDIGEIRWDARLDDEETVSVTSSNLLDDSDLRALEAEAVSVLETEVGATLGVENFTCGTGPVVVGQDSAVPCLLTDPQSGDIFDSTLTITDFETGAFDIVVADQPR